MFIRKKIGSGIVDYVVPTAVIGLVVGLGLFALKDSGNLLNFLSATSSMEVDNGSGVIGQVREDSKLIADKPVPDKEVSDTDTKSDPDTEVICKGDKCLVDVGGYVLEGIPENFADYIESSGSSGGTAVLANIIEQISEKSDLSESEKNRIKQLANLGHTIADREKKLEVIAQKYLKGTQCPEDDIYMGELAWYKDDSYTKQFENLLEEISSDLDNNPSPENVAIKEQLNVLGKEVHSMAKEFHESAQKLTAAGTTGMSDALTSASDVLEPNTGNRTDLDSALICISGKGEDYGLKCN